MLSADLTVHCSAEVKEHQYLYIFQMTGMSRLRRQVREVITISIYALITNKCMLPTAERVHIQLYILLFSLTGVLKVTLSW